MVESRVPASANSCSFHMHYLHVGLHRLERVRSVDHPPDELQQHANPTPVAAQIRRPCSPAAAHHRGYQRLIEWCVPANEMLVSLGESGGICTHGVGVVGIDEFMAHPEGAAVVHKVYYGCDA